MNRHPLARLRSRRLIAVVAALAGATAATVVIISIAADKSAVILPDVSGTQRSDAANRGITLAKAHGGALGLTGDQRLVARNIVLDSNGDEHVRFDRTFKGLPVVGGDIIIHSDAKHAYRGSDGRGKDVSVPSITAKVSPQSAAATGKAATSFRVTQSAPTLAVYALDGSARLVWQTQVDGYGPHGEAEGEMVFVDAKTGAVVDHWPTILEDAGTGKSLYLGSVLLTTTRPAGMPFQMIDKGRGGARTEDAKNGSTTNAIGSLFTDADNVWGNGVRSNRQTAAADANFGVGATWDFYKRTFLRNGIKNDGVGAKSLVHVGTNWVNASWGGACFCMRYGDGNGTSYGPLVSLDVAGHEMTHGVTSATAGLAYTRESGGLNESTSDVMGTMVEFSARLAGDPGDYLIGERFALGTTKPLRYMDKPSKDGRSPDCWSTGVGGLDVHYSSGVGNHFFYLLSEGSGAKTINSVGYNSVTCNASKVVGIGRAKAAAIWYKALTTYWVSSTNYAGARVGMLKAAQALYGYSSPERAAVARAWSAVRVN